MKVLAKVLSIIIILLPFLDIYNSIQLTGTFGFLGVLIAFSYKLLLNIPIFYFGWSKKGHNKPIKIWARISSIIIVLMFILSFFFGVFSFSNFLPITSSNFLFWIFFMILVIVFWILDFIVLLYFGWKKE